MWNLKSKTNKQIQQNRNGLTNVKNRLMIARGERGCMRDKIGEGD